MLQQGQEVNRKRGRAASVRAWKLPATGLTLGAGTVFAKMARDRRGAARLALDDEPRVTALLATANERPVEARVLVKLWRP
ncbi:MAG: hypothetical protein WA624_21850 [Methylocella sp.]